MDGCSVSLTPLPRAVSREPPQKDYQIARAEGFSKIIWTGTEIKYEVLSKRGRTLGDSQTRSHRLSRSVLPETGSDGRSLGRANQLVVSDVAWRRGDVRPQAKATREMVSVGTRATERVLHECFSVFEKKFSVRRFLFFASYSLFSLNRRD
ncbi:hypothetical protein H6P81_005628 [Aristolochia fimbriata]|uniref:Uncharacterized protein n=1 Tax=Aristolochia fimbriata TaxID=158543 RepID=A0AAV7EWE3_ARIFI|nr:hypothetical protein H6P81_005628 [Aristolochia fimbriata]